MGLIDKYKYIHNYNVQLEEVPVVTPGVVVPALLIDDAKQITLAQFNQCSKNLITAHRIQDYRHEGASLILLPEVDILFDRILEASEYYGELLPY